MNNILKYFTIDVVIKPPKPINEIILGFEIQLSEYVHIIQKLEQNLEAGWSHEAIRNAANINGITLEQIKERGSKELFDICKSGNTI